MEWIKEMAQEAVNPVLITGVLVWGGRSVIRSYLEKDLSRFKDRLEVAAREQETRYSVLQTQRADVIRELYSKLVDFVAAAETALCPMGYSDDPPKKDQLEATAKAQAAFGNYYLRNKIYFSQAVCKGIENLFKSVTPSVRKFGFWLNQLERYPENQSEHLKAWDEGWSRFQEEVPKVMEAIEEDFRTLLGVREK